MSTGDLTKQKISDPKPSKGIDSTTKGFVTITPLFNYYLFDAPIAYSSLLKSTLQTWSIDCAKTVFNSRQVHREWQWWLNQAFQSSQTHDALLYLLLNGIKDRRFIDESIVYGKDLIKHAVVQDSVIQASKQMTVDVLINEPRVVSASLDLCKWFVQDAAVYEITKEFMKANCLRDDVYDVMMWQLACGSCDGLAGLSPDNTPVRNSMQQLGFDLLQEPAIMDEAKHNYLIKPLANTFTLGIYGMMKPSSKGIDLQSAKTESDTKKDDE